MFGVKKVFGKIIALLIAATVLLMFFPNMCCLASSSQIWYDADEYNFVDIYMFNIELDDLGSPEILVMYLETWEYFYESDLSGSGGVQLNLDTDSCLCTGWQRGGLGADYIVDITYDYDYGGLVGSLYKAYGENSVLFMEYIFVSHDDGSDYMYFSFPWYYIDSATSFRWNLAIADGIYGNEDYVPADYGYETWQYYSSTPSVNAAFYIGLDTYYCEGYYYGMDAAPYIKNGRTYVPVRYLAYSLGIGDGGIGWDSAAQIVTLTDGYTTVELQIGNKFQCIDGYCYPMDVAPEISNGRTMLPARWVAEAFNATVGWDSVNRMVTITY